MRKGDARKQQLGKSITALLKPLLSINKYLQHVYAETPSAKHYCLHASGHLSLKIEGGNSQLTDDRPRKKSADH